MRLPRPSLVLLTLLPLSLLQAEPTGPERHLGVWLDPAERTLSGRLTQPLPEGGRFRLLDGLAVSEARCDDAALTVTSGPAGTWRVAACDGLATLRWTGTLPDTSDAGALRLTPAGGLLPSRSGWYPHLADAPGPVWLEVHTPAGQRALGSGSLVEQHARADGMHARYHHPRTLELEVASGPWQLREQEVDGVVLRVLFPEALDAAFGAAYLQRAAQHLQAFQQRLGDFPFASFSIAASPDPLGVAFPGFTLLGETVVPLPFIPDTSLPHEMMHAWWGAGVRVDHADGNWAEALTTYLADHAVAEASDGDGELRRGWLQDLAALPAEADSRLRDFRGGPDPAGRLIGYQHGAMLFHMLRQRLGDAAFDGALRALAERWMHRTADWQALEHAFGEAASEDLAPFFAAWRDRPGRPELGLTDVRIEQAADGFRLHGVLVQDGEHAPWPLTVALEVETTAGRSGFTRRLEERRQPFTLALDAQPLALEVDPRADLLRHPGAQPSQLRRLLVDPATRVLALQDALVPLARRALGRQAARDANDADTPLLVVGTTAEVIEWRRAQALPAPPLPLEEAGRARVWMHPERPIGLLSGDDPEGLAMLAARLRHHGQRSYVVLDADGSTRQADAWESGENPLRIEWPPGQQDGQERP